MSTVTRSSSNSILISFQISVLILTGNSLFSQPKVSGIFFSGNLYFSSEKVQEMAGLKPGLLFNAEQLDLDLKNILKNYQKEGFINCSISEVQQEYSSDSGSIELRIRINEGKQVLVGEVVFEGNKSIPSGKLKELMYTKPEKVLDVPALNQDIEQILNRYEERGFAFASVSIKEVIPYTDKQGSEKLRIVIIVSENERVKIDKVVVEGNTETNTEVILRELRLEKNRQISRDKIIDIKQRLENLGYFEAVEQPRIYKYGEPGKNITVLLLKVKEGNTNTFDGIIGYLPPAQDEEQGYFTGLVNLSLKNLFGTGRRIDAKYEKLVKTTQELELGYLEPWVLGYPVNARIGFLQRVQDSSYIRRLVNFKGDALISKTFTASLLFSAERVIPTLSSSEAGTVSVFDSRLLAAGIEIKLDTRDYVYNPSKGLLYRTSYSVGQKKVYNTSSFPGFDIPSDFTVQRLIVDVDFYNSLFPRQTSLLAIHGVDIRSPRLENSDYFRLGGNRTVRGYREEQFLSSTAVWANVELRYSLTRKSFAALFYDPGYYKKPADPISGSELQEGFIYGYGLGLRVETAIGIFGVSYALGKGDTILEGKVHFGFVNDF